MSDTNGLRAALANAHNALELYHAYGWPDRLGVRAALRVQIDALAATQQPNDITDLDRVLHLADEHAEDSHEDGTRVLDRGGLLAFAKDVLRIFGPAPSAPEPLQMKKLNDWKIERKGEAITVCHDVIGGYAATEQDTNIASTVLYHLAATVLATQPTSAAAVVPDTIARIIESLHTQDNRITESPLFAVQQKLRVYGVDADYRDGFEYANEVGETCEEGDKSAREVGYVDHWEFVTGCLTEQGCKDFITINGHNLHEPRIYAYGSYRNAEFIELRKWLMSLRTITPGGKKL